MTKFVLEWVENIVEKGENTGYQHFILFPQFKELMCNGKHSRKMCNGKHSRTVFGLYHPNMEHC